MGWNKFLPQAQVAVVAGTEDERLFEILRATGCNFRVATLPELTGGIATADFEAAIVEAAKLGTIEVQSLRSALAVQPSWSDFPFVTIVSPGEAAMASTLADALGYAALVHRPLDPLLFQNAVQKALRFRALQRQNEAAAERLDEITQALEQRVSDRMRDLRAANARLLREAAERQSAEERYRLAIRATNDAVWDHDLVTDTIHWSDSASGLFGHPGQEVTSAAWWEDKIHPDEREEVLASLGRAFAEGADRWSHAYRFLVGDGSYADIFDRGFIIRDADGTAVRAVGAMMDVTQQRRAEAELGHVQAELIHMSRVSAMGTMASTLAHELNQPLTAISSYIRGSRRVLDPLPQTPRVALQALLEAEEGALRAGQIVRRLRELVSRGHVSVRPEDLAALVEEACGLALVDRHLLRVSHRIELDPGCCWVAADRIQIQQVLINLIRNALEAVREAPRRELVISSTAASESMIEISVSDSGSGIAPEARDLLFSPFQSTKIGGMGIGLSISRTIVEAHGGKIWAEDRPGGGAVFRFTLLRARAPQEQVAAPPA